MSRTFRRLPVLAAALAAAAAAAPSPATAAPRIHLSLGDSYAAGVQVVDGKATATANGFADQVAALAKARGYDLRLVNLGCGGETTTSFIRRTKACPPGALAVGGRDYAGTTQMRAAERYLRANRRRVALVTVSLGGNDVTRCVSDPDAISCVARAAARISGNVTMIAKRLRRAGGSRVRIVGTTYPDVILGEALSPDPARQALADLSVTAFRSIINPALADAYRAGRGRLVDVTAATGAYGPMDETTTIDPYGSLPVPVARVCALTYYCEARDIHMRTEGYAIIARLVADTLPRVR